MGKKPQKNRPLFRSEKWNKCYSLYLANLPTPLTHRLYQQTLQRFFSFLEHKYGHRISPDKVTREDVEEFIHQPVSEGPHAGQRPMPGTRNAYVVRLKSFYRWCKSYRVNFRGKLTPILRDAPTDGMSLARVGECDRDMSEDELRRFFAAIDRATVTGKRDYCIFLALLITGRRRKEILDLTWGDLEPTVFEDEDGPRAGWLYHWQGKGHLTKDDSAEWPAICMTALQDYLQKCGRWEQMRAEDPLFLAYRGMQTGRAIARSHLDYLFRMYARRANIPDNIVVHSLRHESAWQRYLENGHDLLEVRDALRHRNVETTMIYINRKKRARMGDKTGGKLARKFASL